MNAETQLVIYEPALHREQTYKEARAEYTHYSEAEWSIRRQFIDEYTRDWDPVAAAMRLGYNREAAIKMAQKFLDEPAVIKVLSEFRCPAWLGEGRTIKEREILAALWREANDRGKDSKPQYRILAINSIAKYLRMNPTDQDTKLPQIANNDAFKQLPLEEQRQFLNTLRKIVPKEAIA